ncbi:MAG: TonB-dependent receptor plug domain-containing protein [Akkermansiaceae bacterium]|nr:TonB-dependent receptor plug domain-containing protein [Akkermansiaceae bacterium]
MKSIPILSLLAATPVWCQSTSETLAPLIVTASPTERTLFDLVQPATVISGHELAAGNQQTLGEILDGQPGVSATQFAPGSSRPIIRGLGDDRVRILQNGTSVLDVSNVSPDHAVSSDLSSASSVEVVRGPATLLYGPNAIGGVVNVIDGRIAEKAMESGDMNGYFDTKYGSADELFSLSGGLNLGAGPLVFHLDAFTKSTENLEIPGYARSSRLRQDDPQPDEARGFLPNSATESTGGAFGASYIWEKGFIGISFSGLDSEYGLVAEEGVFIDLQQRRWDLRGAFYEPAKGLREINYKFSHSDYEHTEFEGAEVGTIFKTDGYNARVEVKHEKIALLEGAVGFEIQNNDFSALGEEAFLPSVENHAQSLFLFE